MDIQDYMRRSAKALEHAGNETARLDAEVLLAHALGIERTDLYLDAAREIPRDATEIFESLVRRRARGEPVAYLTGSREFWSLPLAVSTGVLIPRPDSESAVEAALEEGHHRWPSGQFPTTILDLGTGSGCLLLALLTEIPAATGIGVDRSVAAVSIAHSNAVRCGLERRSCFAVSDWDTALDPHRCFHMIISNPPYIRSADMAFLAPDVRDFEPAEALDGGAGGLDAYRRILPLCARRLTTDGIVCVEIGEGQKPAVTALATDAGLKLIGCRSDLGGHTRALLFEAEPCER